MRRSWIFLNPVTVKSFNLSHKLIFYVENATGKTNSDFMKEIELMKRVGHKYNSHVVSMICCTTIQEHNALVLEYVKYGDLQQYLQKNKVFVSLMS